MQTETTTALLDRATDTTWVCPHIECDNTEHFAIRFVETGETYAVEFDEEGDYLIGELRSIEREQAESDWQCDVEHCFRCEHCGHEFGEDDLITEAEKRSEHEEGWR
jgi:hypothetical protein